MEVTEIVADGRESSCSLKLEENLNRAHPTASLLYDNNLLFIGFLDGVIHIYSFTPDKIELQGALIGHTNAVSGMVTKDGKYLVSSSCDGTLKIWEVKTQNLLTTASGHSNAVYTVNYSPDGRMLFSGSRDKTLRIWNNHGICKKEISLSSECKVVKECANKLYYTEGANLCRMPLDNFEFASKVLFTCSQAIDTMEISPDGSLAFIACKNILQLLDIEAGKVLSSWKIVAGGDLITALVVNPTKYQIALSGNDRSLTIDLEIRQVTSATSAQSPITSLLWDNTGSYLISTHADGYLRIWSQL